jgi:hypothetical protein
VVFGHQIGHGDAHFWTQSTHVTSAPTYLSKISDFHHSKLILLSKTQKSHFNSIKISQGKNKKDMWGQD